MLCNTDGAYVTFALALGLKKVKESTLDQKNVTYEDHNIFLPFSLEHTKPVNVATKTGFVTTTFITHIKFNYLNKLIII
jgi:hypothetical protein